MIPTIKLEGSYANNNNNLKVVHTSIARSLPPTASTSTSRNLEEVFKDKAISEDVVARFFEAEEVTIFLALHLLLQDYC